MDLDIEYKKRKKLKVNLFLFILVLFLGVFIFINFFFVFPFPGLFILLSMIVIYSIILLELMGYIPKDKTKFQWMLYNIIVAFAISLWTYVGFAMSLYSMEEYIREGLRINLLISFYIAIFLFELVMVIFLNPWLKGVEIKIKCTYCGEEVRSDALKCPNCQSKIKRDK